MNSTQWVHSYSDRKVDTSEWFVSVGTADGEALVAEVYGESQRQVEERANLVSAAPDLLTALHEMVSLADLAIAQGANPPQVGQPLENARAAIQKAGVA